MPKKIDQNLIKIKIEPKNIKAGGKFKWVNTLAYIEPSQIYHPKYILDKEALFVFNEPLNCEVRFEGGYYKIEHKHLDLLVWGDTFEQAIEAFESYFNDIYKVYCLCDENELTKKAIILRNKFLEIIKSVKNQ